MAPDSLAGVLNMSADRRAAFWSGESGLTFNQLRTLAEHFGRGVLFFLELGLAVTEQVHTPQFRTLAQQKPELSQRLRLLIERMERQRALFLSLREDADDALWSPFQAPVLRRLLAVGRLSQATYQAYRAWSLAASQNTKEAAGMRMYRHREPKHIFGDRFVHTVLNALSAGRITLSKASGYLDGLKIADMHALERLCAGA
jgi:hypothetical protein